MAVIAYHVHTLQVVACLDDLNMAAVDSYGSQPCSELLRQLMNDGGWYDQKHLTWKVSNTNCIPRILPAVVFFQQLFQQLFFSAVVFFSSCFFSDVTNPLDTGILTLNQNHCLTVSYLQEVKGVQILATAGQMGWRYKNMNERCLSGFRYTVQFIVLYYLLDMFVTVIQ